MLETILTIFGPLLAGYLGRHLLSVNKWAKVRKIAKKIAEDSNRTNDPREAISQALLEVQMDRLHKEAKKVEAAFHVNGSNKIPKLDLNIEEVKTMDDK